MSSEFPGNVFVSRNYPPPQNVTHEPPAPSVTVTASESVSVSGDYVDSATAAEILGVTTNNVRQMVHKGRLVPASKVGRKNLFSHADVVALRDKRVK